MIIVIGGIKGGSGKTTIATNLAVLRAQSGGKVLLVDADEQKSASDWAQQRAAIESEDRVLGIVTTVQLSGKGVSSQVLKMAADYNDVIIDVGGRDTTSQRSSLIIADLFLIPFKPRSLDIWTIGSVISMTNEVKAINEKLACVAFINQADARGADTEDTIEVLKESPDIVCFESSIGYRKAFGNAAAQGLGVVELKDQDKKASQEIRELYEYVFNMCVV